MARPRRSGQTPSDVSTAAAPCRRNQTTKESPPNARRPPVVAAKRAHLVTHPIGDARPAQALDTAEHGRRLHPENIANAAGTDGGPNAELARPMAPRESMRGGAGRGHASRASRPPIDAPRRERAGDRRPFTTMARPSRRPARCSKPQPPRPRRPGWRTVPPRSHKHLRDPAPRSGEFGATASCS